MSLTAPYTPQQNPVSEIGNRTTVEKARALLKHAGMPSKYWAEAVATAVYLENQTPIASRKFLTTYELSHGRAPSYHRLRVFGCLAYVHIGKEQREGKFADTAKRGVFLGYQEGHHNYRIMLLEDSHVVYSHNVVFKKSIFPLKDHHETFTDTLENDYLHSPEETFVSTQNIDDMRSSALTSHEAESSDDQYPEQPSSEVADIIVPSRIVEGVSGIADLLQQDCNNGLDKPQGSKEISSDVEPSNILPNRTRRSAQCASDIAKALLTTSPDPKTYAQA